MESGIHSVESGIQDSLGLPYMGRIRLSLSITIAYIVSSSTRIKSYHVSAVVKAVLTFKS